ncbi:MAG: NUDIX domain-containing protein [Desulfuromonadaceae bacterium]
MSKTLITHCPQCGKTSLTWPSRKNFACDDCGFVLYLNIAAAAAVIIECRGKILFGIRKHDPGIGMLDLPGGFTDPGESAEETARRELREELNLDIEEMNYLFSFPNKYAYKGIEYDTLDMIFLAKYEIPPEVTAGDDLVDTIWIACDNIEFEKIAFISLRQAVQRYIQEFHPG